MQYMWHAGFMETYSLIECTMTRCVWAVVDPLLMEHLMTTTEPIAKNWLFSMMEVLSHEDLTRMTVTLWAIWTARRKLSHEGIHQSPLSTHLFITRYISELEEVKSQPAPRAGAAATMRKR